jgi:hypothetical protein
LRPKEARVTDAEVSEGKGSVPLSLIAFTCGWVRKLSESCSEEWNQQGKLLAQAYAAQRSGTSNGLTQPAYYRLGWYDEDIPLNRFNMFCSGMQSVAQRSFDAFAGF